MTEGKVQDQQSTTQPDLAGFYKCLIADLLTGDEKIPLSSSSTKAQEIENLSCNASLFSNSIENVVPEFEREMLKTSLRQSVRALSHEVDEVFDPVIRIRQVISCLESKRKENSIGKAPIAGVSTTMHSKKLNASCTNAKEGLLVDELGDAEKETDIDADLKLLLESEESLVEEIIAKQSGELLATLNHLEEQLEGLLYAVASKRRLMTRPEKMHLRELIEKLPARNLERIVEILYHGKLTENVTIDMISVNLEQQENSTLWRVYCYIKAVENARKLSA